ncbi:hypothetical protein B0T22DRAFT_483256 [Podospora appendiculata]|uniref:DUF7730 domain-containing protein n=1 Tax=Podospora appendiculata TaxID=314037 RepID=A0AAE0X2Q6_9PEZI|nr:hypothetical protein B0T22DRAFT_483256 [Podospora appendiculata]
MDALRRMVNRKTIRRQQIAEHIDALEADIRPAHALDYLPTLPSPRRPLTPDPPNATASASPSPLLALPYELRHAIYLLALNAPREIHIDMRYTQATPARPHTTLGAYLHARRWQWRVSTCHRQPGADPAHDRCDFGGSWPTACDMHATPCVLGPEPLALMRACRQLYREVGALLYAANTFHVVTGSVLLYAPRLLLPSWTAHVTSLIFAVSANSVENYAREHLRIEPGWSAYVRLLEALPRAFPGLKSLEVIALATQRLLFLRYPESPGWFNPLWFLGMALLGPMDELVREYGGRLRECSFVLERLVFQRLVEGMGVDEGEITGQFTTVSSRRFWREVDGEGEGKGAEMGYWIRGVLSRVELWSLPEIEYPPVIHNPLA